MSNPNGNPPYFWPGSSFPGPSFSNSTFPGSSFSHSTFPGSSFIPSSFPTFVGPSFVNPSFGGPSFPGTMHRTIYTTSSSTSSSSAPVNPTGPFESSVSPTRNTNVMPRATESPILTPLPAYPPNYHERYQNTITSLRNYHLFQVDTNTFEYAAIASLLDPTLISTVEQIVNPTLWTRFVNARKDMLKSKCNDLELLSKLELSETELLTSYQHSINFEADPSVLAVPYNDNMALLFHCTRDPQNVENILRQGLDERMGSTSGLLGKGIYFTDNPEKSMQYDGCGGIIFIFAVLLGDCLSLDGDMYDFVREPEKFREQRRNFNDHFFDSIVGQPGSGRDNEYVIYNRYQCCPLYMIKYSPGSYTARANPDSREYVTSRKYFPPMSWISSSNFYVTPASVQKNWPFYARPIFVKMGAAVETVDEKVDKKEEEKKKDKTGKKPSGLSLKLQRLSEMGFHDRDQNIEILRKHKFQLDKCVNYLLKQKIDPVTEKSS